MSEPPVLPPDAQARYSSGDNPYSPSHIEPLGNASGERRPFTIVYWGALAFLIPIATALCIYAPGIGIPTAIALVSAAIRVPLMRARPRAPLAANLPQPLILLLTSSLFCLIFQIAATTVFCIVCFPLGLITLGLMASGNETPIFFVFGLSGLIALAAYLFLFRLSLRMSF